MSGVLEYKRCFTVRWKVKDINTNDWKTSREFNVREYLYTFACRLNSDANVILEYRVNGRNTELGVTVQVEGGSKCRILPELTVTTQLTVYTQYTSLSSSGILWQKKLSEVEEAKPGFDRYRELTFLVTFKSQASYAIKDEKLVQTSLCINPLPCFESLSEDFAKMLDTDSNPDVEFHCAEQVTKAHKSVLCVRSPVLAKMLQSDMIESRTGVIYIEDMTNDTLQLFVRYLYTGRLDTLTYDVAIALYRTGDKYGVKSLSRRCAQYLIENLTVENACDVLADAHGDAEFAETVIVFMLAKKVPKSGDRWREFCDSHPKLANDILNRFSDIYVSHEDETLKNAFFNCI